MSRLIDRLYAHGMVSFGPEHPQGKHLPVEALTDHLTGKPLFADATAFVVDNVTEYLFAENDQEHWTFEEDFPCVMLPFHTTWIETRRASKICSSAYPTRVPTEHPLAWGVLLVADRFRDTIFPGQAVIVEQMGRLLDSYRPVLDRAVQRSQQLGRRLQWEECSKEEQMAAHIVQHSTTVAQMPPEQFRSLMSHEVVSHILGRPPMWTVTGWMFLEYQRGRIVGPAVQVCFYVDGTGKVIPVTAPDGSPRHLTFSSWQPFSYDEQCNLQEGLAALLFPVWLALSFCHCKNVEVVPQHHLQRGKPQRYRGRPRVVYHTLNIHPMRRVLQGEGHSASTGLKRALSICRGHFKDYAQGKGLFGKLHGLYWWEQHLRGASQSGVSVADYAVQAPPR